ncbi:hypothetical protein PCE1_004191 [Barthelona sp. PCE]
MSESAKRLRNSPNPSSPFNINKRSAKRSNKVRLSDQFPEYIRKSAISPVLSRRKSYHSVETPNFDKETKTKINFDEIDNSIMESEDDMFSTLIETRTPRTSNTQEKTEQLQNSINHYERKSRDIDRRLHDLEEAHEEEKMALAEDLHKTRREYTSLKTEMKNLHEEHTTLLEDLNNFKNKETEMKKKEDVFELHKKEMIEQQNNFNRVSKQLEQKDQEVYKLQQQVHNLNESISSLQTELNHNERMSNMRKDELERVKSNSEAKKSDMMKEINKLKDDYRKQEIELHEARKNAETVMIKTKMDGSLALDEANNNIAQLNDDIEHFKREIVSLTEENTALKLDNDKVNDHIQQVVDIANQLDNDTEKLRQEALDAAAERDRVLQQNQFLSRQLSESISDKSDLAKENARLQNELDLLSVKEQVEDDWTFSLNASQTPNGFSNADNSMMINSSRRLFSTDDSLESTIDGITQALTMHRSIDDIVAERIKKIENTAITKLKDTVDDLRSDLKESRKQNNDLEALVERSATENIALDLQIKKLKKEMDDLSTTILSSQDTVPISKLKNMQKEMDKLMEERNAAIKRANSHETHNIQLLEKINAVEGELEIISSTSIEKDNRYHAMEVQLKDMTRKLEVTKEENNRASETINSYRTHRELESMNDLGDLDELKATNKKLVEENHNYENLINEYHMKLTSVHTELQRFKTKVSGLNQNLRV